MAERIRAWVVYAAPGIEDLSEVELAPGASIGEAIEACGLAGRLNGFSLAGHRVGVWGKLKSDQAPVADGDRIEIYRPLTADPNTARQHRVEKKRAATRARG